MKHFLEKYHAFAAYCAQRTFSSRSKFEISQRILVLVVGGGGVGCSRKGVANLEMLLELDGQDLRHLPHLLPPHYPLETLCQLVFCRSELPQHLVAVLPSPHPPLSLHINMAVNAGQQVVPPCLFQQTQRNQTLSRPSTFRGLEQSAKREILIISQLKQPENWCKEVPGRQGLCGDPAKAVLSPKITPPRLEIQCPRRRTAPHSVASQQPPKNLLPARCVFRLLHRKRKAQIRVYSRTGSPGFTCPPNWHANRKFDLRLIKVGPNLYIKQED